MTRFYVFGKPLFMFFLSALFFFFTTSMVFGWSGSSGGDDMPTSELQQKGGKAGIIIVDGSLGSEKELDRSKQPGVTLEPGDNFQPRQPGTRLEPGDNFRPGGGDVLRQRDR